MTVLSNIITPSNVLTTTNTATVTNKTLTSPTVTGMVVSDATANGVFYANGSKVLTSGSALTFDGTDLATTGSFSTGNAQNISLNATSTGQTNRLQWKYQGTAYAWIERINSNGDMAFTVQSAEGMRLTSTGLGIGTSSPTQKLTLSGNMLVTGGAYAIGLSGNFYAGIVGDSSGDNLYYKSYQTHIWKTATDPSANSTGTERMRIDSSGNVGIGTTSPSNRVSIVTASGSDGIVSVKSPTTETAGILIDGGSTSNKGALLTLAKDGTTKWRIGLDSAIGGGTNNNLNISGSSTDALLFGTNATERARITSAGDFGLGITAPAAKFAISTGTTDTRMYIQNTTTGTGSGNGLGFFMIGTEAYMYNYAGVIRFGAAGFEVMRLLSDSFLVGKTAAGDATVGVQLSANGRGGFTRSSGDPLYVNRLTDDGTLVTFDQATVTEGSISVSGTTVSYNGGHLSRWAQTTTAKDDSLLKGTVLSNLDAMNVYTDAEGNPVDNEQLNKVKVSDTEGDVNVAGVFVNWSHDDAHNVDEINMAMTGDMIIRIAQGVTVVRGDLLMSAGDGTAKPQGDDIIRSKTVAKVTSNHVTCTYADGSYCVPCVLMAC